jgi:AcrR family transcriptional regulator
MMQIIARPRQNTHNVELRALTGPDMPDSTDPRPDRDAGAGGARRGKKARTRQEIIDATVALIDERGYDDTTVGHIARRAGITTATFYNHFADKDAVFAQAYIDSKINWTSAIEDQLQRDVSVIDKLRSLTVQDAAWLLDNSKLARIFHRHGEYQTTYRMPAHLARTGDGKRQAADMVEHRMLALFREGQDAGELTNAHSAEMLFMVHRVSTMSIIRMWSFGQLADDAFTATRVEALEILLEGIAAPPP